jgi:hypothetical protein
MKIPETLVRMHEKFMPDQGSGIRDQGSRRDRKRSPLALS